MNKRGKLFIVIGFFLIVFLVAAYVQLYLFYTQFTGKDYHVSANIGGKQGAVLTAVREGERMQAYITSSNTLAVRETNQRALDCGLPYLGYRLIGAGACADTTESTYASAMTRYLAAYPGTISGTWQSSTTRTGSQIMIDRGGTVRIPIGGQSQPATAAAGTYTGWPTGDHRVTSLFGNRNTGILGASRNHPGIDIGAFGQVGTPVTSISDGMATFIPDVRGTIREDHIIRVTQGDGVIIEYVHVIPVGSSGVTGVDVPQGSSVAVHAGEVIGVTAPHRGGPHVHLQVRLADVDDDAATQLWPTHAGPSDRETTEQSFAVTRAADHAAYLDPVCFFDRATITDILQSTNLFSGAVFAACDAYEQAFHLSTRLAPPALQQAPQTTTAAQPSASLGVTQHIPKVDRTFQNVQQYSQQYGVDLIGSIQTSASTYGVDPRLLLAVITQESEGDPTLISPTGPAGIAQMSADTAQKFFSSKDRSAIHACCTAGEVGAACQDPAQNQCVETGPNQDPRFDPVKSTEAQARLLNYLLGVFGAYDQKMAFALAAYNAGEGKILDAVRATGPNPTWNDVQATILSSSSLSFGVNGISDVARRKEITNYVNAVLQWYAAWGGHDLAGSTYTGAQLGYYDLNVHTQAAIDRGMNDAIEQLHQAVMACADQGCIDRAIALANGRYRITREDPNAPQCASPQEAAMLYYANQFQSCVNAPQDKCSCPLDTSVDAELIVSDAETRLGKLNGNTVAGPSTAGLGANGEGESASAQAVLAYQDGKVVSFADSFATLGVAIPSVPAAVLAPQRGAVFAYAVPGSTTTTTSPSGLQGAIASTVGKQYNPIRLFKSENMLGFTGDTFPACVEPPRPELYCIADTNGQHMLFFVDRAAHSVVSESPALTSYRIFDGTLKRITFTGPPMTAVQATITDADGTRVLTMSVTDLGTLPQDAFEQAARDGVYVALRSGMNYQIIIPRLGSEQLALGFLDENGRTGPLVAVGTAEFGPTP